MPKKTRICHSCVYKSQMIVELCAAESPPSKRPYLWSGSLPLSCRAVVAESQLAVVVGSCRDEVVCDVVAAAPAPVPGESGPGVSDSRGGVQVHRGRLQAHLPGCAGL